MGIVRGLPLGKIRDFMADEEMGHGCSFFFKVGGSRTEEKAYSVPRSGSILKSCSCPYRSSQWEGCEIKERTKLDLGRVLRNDISRQRNPNKCDPRRRERVITGTRRSGTRFDRDGGHASWRTACVYHVNNFANGIRPQSHSDAEGQKTCNIFSEKAADGTPHAWL